MFLIEKWTETSTAIKHANESAFLEYIEANRALLKGRPQTKNYWFYSGCQPGICVW